MANGPELLRKRMQRRKLTMTALAARIGRTQAAVSRWINGHRVPEAKARIALRKEMGIPIEAWDSTERLA